MVTHIDTSSIQQECVESSVKLILDDQPVVITLVDADEMRMTLLKYLERSRAQTDESTLNELRLNRPVINPDHVLRIASWLLETRLDRIVLTRGQHIGSELYFDIAYLEKTSEGHWEVTDFDNEYISPK